MNIEDWYLDLSKIKDLPESDRNKIHQYYDHMLMYEHDGRTKSFLSIFKTLEVAGYISNYKLIKRKQKLDELIDEEI